MQYVPFASDIEIPFYASLASHKINTDKLSTAPRPLLGLYEIRPADSPESSCRMQIHANALAASDANIPAGAYRAEGMIKNVNTIEEYRSVDKVEFLKQAARTIWEGINDGTIFSSPSLLAGFVVLSFADLKKYRFSYWFAFPAIVMEPGWAPVVESGVAAGNVEGGKLPHKKLTADESSALVDVVQTWRYGCDSRQHGFFLAKKTRRPPPKIEKEPSSEEGVEGDDEPPLTPSRTLPFYWQVASLSNYETGFFEGEYSDDCYVCFADPSNYAEPGPVAPGWVLRNLLVLVRQRWKRDRVQILCYRETQSRRDAARSIILDMEIPRQSQSQPKTNTATEDTTPKDPLALPKVVGWERNAQGKLAGRLVDLTEYMDPKRLADSSVDLNLKLMKWRISPNLNLDIIKNARCLLLGAGTLGSYVSRNLLGWGVRKITFVDNGSVSFSNPVRQPLFTFKDCLEGGGKKALVAAEALKEIYPGVDAQGHVMSVPMAGHPVVDVAKTQGEYEKLKELIEEHDVVFLLMDSRESRWLPTVMGKAAGKLVVNAALGFDTFVVLRHGVRSLEGGGSGQKPLGCYFCNDVVAPQDSMKDLTLDQQCTVTRPGIAAIASALLVELVVSVLQHPQGHAAPAATSADGATGDREEHPLGIVPHQIRGFLSSFTNLNIVGQAYDCCSACSEKVLTAYEEGGWAFVEKALNDKDYVEELSGLKEVQRAAEAAAADIEFSEEEEVEEDGDGELV